LKPIVRHIRALLRDMAGALRLSADLRSCLRLAGDFALYRLMRFLPSRAPDRERVVRLRNGLKMTYRLNRGDIWAVRQMWIDEVCRLPIEMRPDVIVDLGANIGIASLWLAKRYGCSRVIAVEPLAANARLARRNLEENGIAAEVLEAAAGPKDGEATFLESADGSSANGRLIADTTPSTAAAGDGKAYTVRMVSLETLLQRLPEGTSADLVKLDIEGGEQPLLCGDLAWLRRVRALIVEFHPRLVDCAGLAELVRGAGFRQMAMGTQVETTDFFIREQESMR
jgi:FkbM family methyltransferase